MLRILDRYTLREILPPFVLALLVFTFMLMMGPIDRVAQQLLAKGAAVTVVMRMLVLLVPQALAITIPTAFLLALLVAFGRLSGDSEWVAMQACGVTVLRMLRPVLLMATLCWAATSWVLIEAVPAANQAFREIEFRIISVRAESEIRPRIFFADFPDLVLYTRDIVPENHSWRDVFVADTRQQGHPQVSMARAGRMLITPPDPEGRRPGKMEMVLEDRVTYSVSTDASGRPELQENPSRSLIMLLDPSKVFNDAMPMKGEPEKTIAELRQSIEEARQAKMPTERPEYYLHLKFSIPVACFVFALMGLGFGVSSGRGGKLAAFALGSGVIFAYYIIMYQARSLSMGHVWPAWFAAWLPNIVLGPAGVVVLYRKARSAGASFQLAVPAVGFLKRFLPARESDGGAFSAAPGRRPVLVIRFPQFGLPRLSILDRYISKTYLRIEALTFISLLGIFYVSQFIDLSDKLFSGKTTADTVFWYFFFQTPQFVYYIIPLSVLIATLVTVGILTRNSELIVMRACGVSLYRTAVPLLALALGAAAVLFGIEDYALAASNRHAEDLNQLIRYGKVPARSVLNRQWTVGKNGDIYHYSSFNPRGGILRDFTRYEFDPTSWKLSRLTFAESVRFEHASAKADSPVGAWKATGGWVRELKGDSESTYAPFTVRELAIETPDYFGAEPPEAASMTYAELRDYINEMQGAGHNILQYLVDLHRKVAFPFATIVMTLLAVPFAALTGRRGTLYGIGVGIVLAIVYWTSNNLFGLVGTHGLVTPMLAAWAPNLLFGAGAAYLLLTVRT
jgi:LPS export ABC transporter permease LptG/LPS export ABC transporter permease LptF